MGETKIVNVGVDTLVLNAFYLDERGRPVKCELDPSSRSQLDEWKRAAQEVHEESPTTLMFNGAVLHISPNGAGQGQWPWMLKTKDITLYISGGHWNGIAAVRFSSQYLWSCKGILDAVMSGQTFLDDLFKQEVYLQVSSVDLCVDVVGWEDVQRLDRIQNFISRSRKRMVRDESEWVDEVKSREYSVGLPAQGMTFPGGKHGSSALSCRMYDKSRETQTVGQGVVS